MLPELLGSDYDPFDFELDGPDGDGELRSRPHPRVEQRLQARGHRRSRARARASTRACSASSWWRCTTARSSRSSSRSRPRGAARRTRDGTSGRTPTLEVRSGKPIDIGIDGEAVTLDSPVRLEVQPGALRVRIAPHHPGVSPARVAGAVQAAVPRVDSSTPRSAPDRRADTHVTARGARSPVSIVVSLPRSRSSDAGSGPPTAQPTASPLPMADPATSPGEPRTAVTGGATASVDASRKVVGDRDRRCSRSRRWHWSRPTWCASAATTSRRWPAPSRPPATAQPVERDHDDRRPQLPDALDRRAAATLDRGRLARRLARPVARQARRRDRRGAALLRLARVERPRGSRVLRLARPRDHRDGAPDPEVVVFIIGTNDWTAVSGDWKERLHGQGRVDDEDAHRQPAAPSTGSAHPR